MRRGRDSTLVAGCFCVDGGFWYSMIRMCIAWIVFNDSVMILDHVVSSGLLISVYMDLLRSSKYLLIYRSSQNAKL